MYRAISVRIVPTDDERETKRFVNTEVFPTIVDSYKYLLNTPLTKNNPEEWHIKLLWPVLETFQKELQTLVRIAYTNNLDTQLWIQWIENETDPLPDEIA